MPIAFYFRDPAGDYLNEHLRFALSQTAKICREMEAQRGTSGFWRRIVARVTNLSALDATGYGRSVIRTQINLEYGDLP